MPLLRDQSEKSMLGRYSSFASVENTLSKVVERLMKNDRLKRLLYYTDRHALGLPRLNQEQSYSLLNHQLRIVPKLTIEHDAKPFVIISLDNFVPFEDQTTFRSFQLSFDILVPFEFWQLDNFKLRPYAIAGEIDGMINNDFVIGTQVADFQGAKQLILNESLGGLSLFYNVETYKDDKILHPVERK